MTKARYVAHFAAVGVLLAACAVPVLAEDQKKKREDRPNSSQGEHSGRSSNEQRAAPQGQSGSSSGRSFGSGGGGNHSNTPPASSGAQPNTGAGRGSGGSGGSGGFSNPSHQPGGSSSGAPSGGNNSPGQPGRSFGNSGSGSRPADSNPPNRGGFGSSSGSGGGNQGNPGRGTYGGSNSGNPGGGNQGSSGQHVYGGSNSPNNGGGNQGNPGRGAYGGSNSGTPGGGNQGDRGRGAFGGSNSGNPGGGNQGNPGRGVYGGSNSGNPGGGNQGNPNRGGSGGSNSGGGAPNNSGRGIYGGSDRPGNRGNDSAPNRGNFGNAPRGNDSVRGGFGGGHPGGPGSRIMTTSHGDIVRRDASGQVRQVHMNNGATIYHPPTGGPRRIEMARPGGRFVVAGAPGHGYVQRPIVVRNTTIIKRTYVYNGVPRAMIYRPHTYHGISINIYTPVRYYRPAFYTYAYNPWPRPIYYSWGWSSRPWYGYYGGYFTPYPAYASPSLWLTDYLIATTLEAAYEERMAARAASYQASAAMAPMSPDVKQAVADEVRRQIDEQRLAGQNSGNGPGTDIFSDGTDHVFVVNNSLEVDSSAGSCVIAEGDVLRMAGPPAPNAPSAGLVVLSSRGDDCRRGSTVYVGVADLQEMHNHMLATIERGMGDLQSKQGQGGLPSLPAGSAGTIDTAYVSEAQPDPSVLSDINSVSQDADRAEQQAISQATEPAGGTVTLTLGMSLDQVRAIQGEPQKIVDMGARQIYVYKDLKITFAEGRVTNIE